MAAVAVLCFGARSWAADPGAMRLVDHVTLKNGSDLICDHVATVDGRARLYGCMDADSANYFEVDAADIVSDERVSVPVVLPADPPAVKPAAAAVVVPGPEKLNDQQLKPILAQAEKKFDIDEDLLASVIKQESGGHSHAVSRAGAQGLMQLMPQTASDLGVQNTFAPNQNIAGGTAYLDWLLKRYNDNLPLALAAYNAGPAAVDRWHGIPPYRETRAYVARVIHEYNRRYAQRHKNEPHPTTPAAVVAEK
ncbi:MAG TPA: lytic transglycosylase domain-containing protein [Acidobacteriaceae bacterium]|nr:lytic transglycosylase domain-containing protein [Acidobacteriaceae bacterium]